MLKQIQYRAVTALCAVSLLLQACAPTQPAVIETLDELTAVTLTHSRTPFIMSPEVESDSPEMRDFLSIGTIEVNRAGKLSYFLWFGISEATYGEPVEPQPEAFTTVTLSTNGQSVPLQLEGWSHTVIGASESLYTKLFQNSVDAYYEVSIEQIEMLQELDSLTVTTAETPPREFVSWYRQKTAREDLAEFLNAISL